MADDEHGPLEAKLRQLIAWRISENPAVQRAYVAGGQAGGTPREALAVMAAKIAALEEAVYALAREIDNRST